MLRCKSCLQYTHPIDQYGLCVRCGQKSRNETTHLVAMGVDARKMSLHTTGGRVLSRARWAEIKRKVDAYYAGVSDDDIDEFNAQVTTSKQTAELSASSSQKIGYIYLLSSSVGYHKIGKAINVDQRLKNHLRSYPIELKVVHSVRVENMSRCESFLLRTFKEKKKQGEWFALSHDDVNWIKSLDGQTLDRLSSSKKHSLDDG